MYFSKILSSFCLRCHNFQIDNKNEFSGLENVLHGMHIVLFSKLSYLPPRCHNFQLGDKFMLKINSATATTYIRQVCILYFSNMLPSLYSPRAPIFNWGRTDIENEFNDLKNLLYDVHIVLSPSPLQSTIFNLS